MVKISIIVPVYNVEIYLKRCIDSLINQTFEDVEIILVDDESPDECPAICDKYAEKDKRVKVIHKKNGGVSAARNDGLAIATGDWVIFCDSDDWMELDALEILYDAAIQEEVDVAVGDINKIKGHEVVYNRFFANEFTYTDRKDMDDLVMADLYQNYCPNPPSTPTIGYGGPWNKLVRRQFLIDHDICFDTSLLGIFDDILYTAYIYANMNSITYIQKPVYNYVMASNSLTKSYKDNTLKINERIFSKFTSFKMQYAPDGKWDKAFDAMVIRRFEETLRLYFFNTKNPNKLPVRLKELKEIMRKDPYTTAAKNVDMSKLLFHHKEAALLLRMKSTVGLWLLYKTKIFLRRI